MRSRLGLVLALAFAGVSLPTGAQAPASTSAGAWSFAVSGDSRDCGDLVMPKIARAVLAEKSPGAAFYWHLGDFRRMYDIDCDILKRKHPAMDCRARNWDEIGRDEVSDYLDGAWKDFIDREIKPFGALPVLLGIGNHELYGRTREEFQRVFQPWLTQPLIQGQRGLDSAKGMSGSIGDSTFRVIYRGVDFINLDNADEHAFTPRQLQWLSRVLEDDVKRDDVTTIVVGMHKALPYSTSRGHAMDASCQNRCSGQSAYDLLFRAQAKKKIYVFASHSHYFSENVYDTPEHKGQVLPGWIIGTAGAEQYQDVIRYGYARVDVAPEGTLSIAFREVGRDAPPLATGLEAGPLTRYCYEENKRKPGGDRVEADCACGAAR